MARHHRVCVEPRVWTWNDLWREVAAQRGDAPAVFAEAGGRAVLEEAIRRASAQDRLKLTSRVADLPGFRRRLRGKIASWTSWESRPDSGPPEDMDAADAEQWAIFAEYRALLHSMRAEDASGLAVWSSRALAGGSMAEWADLDAIHVLDLSRVSKAVRRVLDYFRQNVRRMRVSIAYDPAPRLSEVYQATAGPRQLFLDWEFQEEPADLDWDRPSGLTTLERDLFRDDEHELPKAFDADGLTILGGPRGDGTGMLAARRTRELLDDGAELDEVLLLVRRWDEHAVAALETLKAWGLPIAEARGRSLATQPAVKALLLMARLPAEGWEAKDLVAFLRNSQMKPPHPDAPTLQDRAIAASAVQQSRVFRGLGSLRRAMARTAAIRRELPDSPDAVVAYRRAKRAGKGQEVLQWLVPELDPLNRSAPWRAQVALLFETAKRLGIGLDDGPEAEAYDDRAAIEHFRNALDDYGAALLLMGQGDAPWAWPAFVDRVESLSRSLTIEPEPPLESRIVMATVDDADGLRADHVIMLNLDEGTFPVPEAVDPRLSEAAEAELDEPYYSVFADPLDAAPQMNLIWSRELLRFTRVVGSSRRSLTLIHSATDESGQRLLPAGFLDDVKRRFRDGAFPEPIARLNPVDPGDLAGSLNDLRVQAVAQAIRDHPARLLRLAESPRHRPALEAIADAFEMAHSRFAGKTLGVWEGMLHQAKIRQELVKSFHAEKGRVLSPTQLESYILCPFQFFARFILSLVPVDERDELEQDKSDLGRIIHDVLEQLHERLASDAVSADDQPQAWLRKQIEATIEDVVKARMGEPHSLAEAGRQEIEAKRLHRIGERYAAQYELYREGHGKHASPQSFEVQFGRKPIELAKGFNRLVIGEGDRQTALQGIIDRIDIVCDQGQEPKFRVIDYKSGHCPIPKDIFEGDQIQLPLYALAIEELGLLDDQTAKFGDFGYWDVNAKGFRQVTVADWPAFRQALESYLLAVADRIRDAQFPVVSRDEHCTAFCEYKSACRVAQVRQRAKVWEDAPRFEAPGVKAPEKPRS